MISTVRAYARERMKGLGYVEWVDGFNFTNIPSTKLDSAFHIETLPCRGVSNNQAHEVIECPIIVRFFAAPTLRPGALIDTLVAEADAVISDFLGPRNSYGSGLKNVDFDSAAFKPLNNDNDNGVIAEIGFTMEVIISTR